MAKINTCTTCANYIPTLVDPDSQFHLHNYCSAWRSVIPASYMQDKKCDESCLCSGVIDCSKCPNRFDDIESNTAWCWCYEAKEVADKADCADC